MRRKLVPQIGGPLRVQLTRSMGSRLKTMIGGSLSLSRALSLSLARSLVRNSGPHGLEMSRGLEEAACRV